MSWKVYVHITPSLKLYIGITSQNDVATRWDNGFGYRNQKLFWRAICKYGWENITHIVLIENLSKQCACECEKYLIAKYNTNNPKYGYNLTDGGEGISGYKLTEEQREIWRKASSGRHHSEATKHKISEINKGRVYTDEQKKAMSERATINPSRGMLGKHHSEETKQKISISRKGKGSGHTQPHSEETKLKISLANKGRTVSQETREKLRQKALEQWKHQKHKQEE